MTPETRSKLHSFSMPDAVGFWDVYEKKGRETKKLQMVVRDLCQNDLFYLLVRVCQRKDMLHPWIYARTREVEESPDGHLDLWARPTRAL